MVNPINFQRSFNSLSQRGSGEARHALSMSTTLRATGDHLDPAAVTQMLEKVPSVSARRGEVLRRRGHHYLVAEKGTWFGKIGSHALSGYPRAEFPPLLEELQALGEVPQAERLEVSILLNGPKSTALDYAERNASTLAATMTALAKRFEVDFNIPTAGVEILLERGDILVESDLLARLGLPSGPKP